MAATVARQRGWDRLAVRRAADRQILKVEDQAQICGRLPLAGG
jgi:hypothetical protein